MRRDPQKFRVVCVRNSWQFQAIRCVCVSFLCSTSHSLLWPSVSFNEKLLHSLSLTGFLSLAHCCASILFTVQRLLTVHHNEFACQSKSYEPCRPKLNHSANHPRPPHENALYRKQSANAITIDWHSVAPAPHCSLSLAWCTRIIYKSRARTPNALAGGAEAKK